MKHWLYSEGEILGPYSTSELIALPAFGQGSLVCPETADGNAVGDWRAAENVPEIAAALSVTAGSGPVSYSIGMSGIHDFEPAPTLAPEDHYFDSQTDQPYTCEDILSTIDNVLGAYKDSELSEEAVPAAPDYELLDQFDIRLARMQEQLEAARWEKDQLLEKIRTRETLDRGGEARILELENKLRETLRKARSQETELEELEAARWEKNQLVEKMQAKELADKENETHIAELESRLKETLRKAAAQEKELADLEAARRLQAIELEDLENARKEKEELVRKVRAKDLADRENEARILELENKLKETLNRSGSQEKEIAELRRMIESVQSGEPPAKTWEAEKEEAPETPGLQGIEQAKAEAKPATDTGRLKSLRPSQEVSLEKTVLSEDKKEEKKETLPTSRRLKRLSPTQLPGIIRDDKTDAGSAISPLPSPTESVRSLSLKPVRPAGEEPSAPPQAAPEQPATPIRPEPQIPEIPVLRKIEPAGPQAAPVQQPLIQPLTPSPAVSRIVPQGVVPPAAEQASPSAAPNMWPPQSGKPAPAAGPAAAPAAQPAQSQQTWPPVFTPQAASITPSRGPSFSAAAQKETAAPEVTERITIFPKKEKEETGHKTRPAAKGRGKMTFMIILMVFSVMVVGGLGYFFLGGGVSFSEFSMMNFGGAAKSRKASFSTQIEPQSAKTDTEEAFAAQEPAQTQPAQSAPAGGAAAPEKPAAETTPNENTRKAMETVKNYKLSGGRGTVSAWFANSFLSTSASGSNEEWSATILHGNIFVVQYRLLRPKQDPLIYQFEVDVEKGVIVRGINNSAIELLDFSTRITPKAEAEPKTEPAPKAKPKAATKPRKPRGIPILPLPDEPETAPQQEELTGFETAANIGTGKKAGNEKVRYIMAQESDEELF